MIAITFALHLIINIKPFQLVPRGFGTIGRIRVKGRLVAQKKRVALGAVMGVASGDGLAVDKPILIHAGVD